MLLLFKPCENVKGIFFLFVLAQSLLFSDERHLFGLWWEDGFLHPSELWRASRAASDVSCRSWEQTLCCEAPTDKQQTITALTKISSKLANQSLCQHLCLSSAALFGSVYLMGSHSRSTCVPSCSLRSQRAGTPHYTEELRQISGGCSFFLPAMFLPDLWPLKSASCCFPQLISIYKSSTSPPLPSGNESVVCCWLPTSTFTSDILWLL